MGGHPGSPQPGGLPAQRVPVPPRPPEKHPSENCPPENCPPEKHSSEKHPSEKMPPASPKFFPLRRPGQPARARRQSGGEGVPPAAPLCLFFRRGRRRPFAALRFCILPRFRYNKEESPRGKDHARQHPRGAMRQPPAAPDNAGAAARPQPRSEAGWEWPLRRKPPVLSPRPRGRGIYSGASGDVLIRAIPVPAGGGDCRQKFNLRILGKTRSPRAGHRPVFPGKKTAGHSSLRGPAGEKEADLR